MRPRAITMRVFVWSAAVLLAVNITGFAQGGKACSDATLHGRYAFTETGSILEVGPVAVAGVFKADGKGNVTAEDTVSLNGEIRQESLNFTYQVNPDCTGAASSAPGQEPAHFNFVLIENGKEAVGIHTDPGTTLLLSAKKQFAVSGGRDARGGGT
ncbi:MAG: hypothetical protein KGM47_08985 [Acidobacteriota bacterium]|nr:hypothetical protein [Acidobacteriota bacterium]